MNIESHFGSDRRFQLSQAILLYEELGKSVVAATIHDVRERNNQLTIEPGQSITLAGIESLALSLGKRLENSFLPERVLSVSMSRLAWWCPARRARIWFNPADNARDAALLKKLNGKFVQHPPLLFVAGNGLRVLALAENKRPAPNSTVFRAPYFNLSPEGLMCAGTAKLPDTIGPTTIEAFEKAFFNSAFSHSNWGHQITKHPKGHAGLWAEMARRKVFPARYLVSASQTANSLVTQRSHDH